MHRARRQVAWRGLSISGRPPGRPAAVRNRPQWGYATYSFDPLLPGDLTPRLRELPEDPYALPHQCTLVEALRPLMPAIHFHRVIVKSKVHSRYARFSRSL